MLPNMSDGVVRRNVDARIVSYAMSIVSTEDPSPELQATMQGCAAAALQAASGMVALSIACQTASTSQSILGSFESNREREHFVTLMQGLGSSLSEAWSGELKELFELIVVMAAQTSEAKDEERFRLWAQGLFLDTRPLCIGDSSDVKAQVEVGEDTASKRRRLRKPRSSKDVYQQDRFENLVTKAIALGVTGMTPVLSGGQVHILGQTLRGPKLLIKLRGSINEAKEVCDKANDELRRMKIGEAFP